MTLHHVTIVGDSHVSGQVGAALVKKLGALGVIEALAVGRPGATTQDLYESEDIRKVLVELDPDILIVMSGTNDHLRSGSDYVKARKYFSQACADTRYVEAPPYVNNPLGRPGLVEGCRLVREQQIKAYGEHLIDLFALPLHLFDDGIHFTPGGGCVAATRIVSALGVFGP